jgi:CDP-diacylglycerol--serine O-phosphatidyltransferase
MSDAPHAPVDGSTRARARRLRGRLRRRTDRAIPGVKVLPTMMTLANLVCGFAAIFYAARAGEAGGPTPFGWHPLTVAGVLVFLGMAFDAVDGSLARLTRSTSDLGAQLDSLADVVTFGVAPAFMMLRLVSLYDGPGEHGPAETILGPDAGNLYARLCWSVAAIYICCTALRLARFNVETASADEDDHLWFKGLPSPGAGGAVASLALLHHFVNRYLKGRKSVPAVAFALMVVAIAVWWFHESLAVALTGYALSGPVGALLGRRPAPEPEP